MIGERLQELRKDKRVSQAELGRMLGVSSNTISSYECNRSDPDDNLKIILAKFFDISVDYLLGLTDEPYSYRRDKRAVVIPGDFSSDDVHELTEYIKYLEYKKNKND